eukprot:TRINITY_DN31129_c0_g1_i1.p1 TRINITY_DN31129_c0_g1~~TRINITY_DN31129_c0_g1_i1.p1  ORF type:complete len:204 (-),score=26.74 TRINITY_DN31129_c0_g1_i1:67-678(-)
MCGRCTLILTYFCAVQGAIALDVSRAALVDGMILLAPMIKQSAQNVPAAPVVSVLKALAWVAPSLPAISSNASNSEVQYTDPERRQQCDSDQIAYSGKLRLATAATLLGMATELHGNLEQVSCPFFAAVGGREVVVDPQGVEDLFARASTPESEKVFRRYADAQHGLLAEPLPLRSQIEADIRDWVQSRLRLPRRVSGSGVGA